MLKFIQIFRFCESEFKKKGETLVGLIIIMIIKLEGPFCSLKIKPQKRPPLPPPPPTPPQKRTRRRRPLNPEIKKK